MEIRPRDKMDLRRQSVYRFLCIRFLYFSFTITFSIISTPFSEAL